ncbi:MAG: glutathione S-transferase family protein [Ramlibacter sp.]
MKLYYHPASTSCRPIMLFAEEAGIALDYELVDIFTGQQYKPPFESINPNHLVPVLEDGDFRLTEVSAILKYVAEKTGSPAYPKDLKQRARVNERMDWFNTQINREFNYGFVYPQIFGFMKRPTPESQDVQVQWGKERAQGWLKVLNDHVLGSGNPFLCGNQITIADYLGAAMIGVGEVAGCQFSDYPNVRAWLTRMKALPSWGKVHEAISGYAASLKGQQFVSV